ncbi:Cytochrome P450 [Mycena venus]|uniref:Cytochrome P450 n=1 Tax=Mycena venus TaxID=2733690 RepID=A0A8H6XNC4_9AGAR|nr:Cytochrome P450 [Mycena venus]
MMTMTPLLLLAVALKFVFEAVQCLKCVFLHPLSTIPGPWYASLSDWWLAYHTFRFEQANVVHNLFAKFGPIVRAGPNKILFRDAQAMRDVYIIRRFEKGPVYQSFKLNGMDHAFTILDNESHAARRRASGPHYSAANIAHFQSQMHKETLSLVDKLESIAGQMSVDCLDLLKTYHAQLAVLSIFGYHLGAVEKWSTDTPNEFCQAISDFPKQGIVKRFFPRWVWALLCCIPNKRWKSFTQCSKLLTEFAMARTLELEQQLELGKEFEASPPLVYRLLQYHQPLSHNPLEHDVVITDCLAHLIAGVETTANTLVYFLWQLACSPQIQRKLQLEIDSAMLDRSIIPKLSILQNLPYLNAFINEGCIFRPPRPRCDFRSIGTCCPAGSELHLAWTRPSPPALLSALKRGLCTATPTCFPPPETFDPERWLDNSEPAGVARATHMMPFGIGTRVCSGQALAQAALLIPLVAIVRNFRIRAGESTTDESMRKKHGSVRSVSYDFCDVMLIK